MTSQPLRTLSARVLHRELSLSDEALLLAEDDYPAHEFLRRLRSEMLSADAIRLMPHLMPKRRAVWWGCLCAWHAHRQQTTAEAAGALDAALRWLVDPSESHRRACETAAKAADLQTSPGCVAMSAFWATGSMSQPDLPHVAPPPELTAKVIAGAVLLAAAELQPHRLFDHYVQFLDLGDRVADGQLHWRGAEHAPAPANLPSEARGGQALRPPHWHSTVFAVSPGGEPRALYSTEDLT